MAVAQPKCPDCGIIGREHIISEESIEKTILGSEWFNIVFCDSCGHVYGVFTRNSS